jgi:hypothetical protein
MKRILIAFIFSLLIGGPAFGANCGGETPCACGDTLTATYTLQGNLDCTNSGNVLNWGANNVKLYLNGYTISGDRINVKEAIYSDGYNGVEIRGPGTITDTEGIKVYSGDGTIITGVTITNAIDVDSDDGGNDAIYIGQDAGAQPANVEISSNTIGTQGSADDITRQGIAIVACDTVEISDNTIYGGRIGIDIEPNATRTVTDFSLLRNTIDTLANTAFYGGGEYHMGISIDENTGTIDGTSVVTGNRINLNDDVADGKATMFYLRGLANSPTITLKDNIGTGIKRGVDIQGGLTGTVTFDILRITAGSTNYGLGFNFADAAINSVTFRNFILNDFLYPIDVNMTSAAGVINFYNGTIDVDRAMYFGMRVRDFGHTINMKNCIFHETPESGHVYVQVAGASPTFTADNNCYETEGNYWNWQGATDINFAEWQVNVDANGVNTDPLLNADYSIQKTSSCRNAGDNSVVDASVRAIWGGTVDIGAIEYEEKGISGGIFTLKTDEIIYPLFGMRGADGVYMRGADGEYLEYYH